MELSYSQSVMMLTRYLHCTIAEYSALVPTHSPAEGEEGTVAVLPEPLVLHTAGTTHGLHHLLVQLHGRGKYLGVTPQNIAKVHMDQVTSIREEKVVKVTITHTQQICNDTVARYMHMCTYLYITCTTTCTLID